MFGFFKGKNNETVQNESNKTTLEYVDNPIQLNLTKGESLIQLDFRKATFDDVCSGIPDLQNMKAKVALVLDYSGSMTGRYHDGTVQALIERIMPIASKFDDNGELDLWIFEDRFNRLPSINIDNFHGITNYIQNHYGMGGTNYAPVMEDIIRKYTVEEPSDLPTYVLFVTDGDNFDKSKTTKLICNTCTKPIFWQCVGVGQASMSYLEKLDDLPNREVDNVDFFKITNPNNVTDESLYRKLFDEYPSWIQTARKKRIIK